MPFPHITVMASQLVDTTINLPGLYVDATAGGGGHTALLLAQTPPNSKILALDRDIRAIEHLHERFKNEIESKKISVVHAKFSDLPAFISDDLPVQGIIADLGVSSPQLDEPKRGFSLQKNGPLDMRMQDNLISAAEIVNTSSMSELKALFYTLGEEPKSHFIAQAIVTYRETKPITETLELANIVMGAIHYKSKSKKHPATRVFQALRLAVNNELGELKQLLEKGFSLLAPSGRLSVISFHSLEDRIIKTFIKSMAQGSPVSRDIPLTADRLMQLQNIRGKILKPFPQIPSVEECENNPRARSAKLRTIEKLAKTKDCSL